MCSFVNVHARKPTHGKNEKTLSSHVRRVLGHAPNHIVSIVRELTPCAMRRDRGSNTRTHAPNTVFAMKLIKLRARARTSIFRSAHTHSISHTDGERGRAARAGGRAPNARKRTGKFQ